MAPRPANHGFLLQVWQRTDLCLARKQTGKYHHEITHVNGDSAWTLTPAFQHLQQLHSARGLTGADASFLLGGKQCIALS